MTASGVWFGNDNWPTGRSLGEFAKDVFRIENCKTDKEKALAFYEWNIRCMRRGPNLYLASASGTYARCFDPTTMMTSWGSYECTGWGYVAAEALCAAGLKARRVVCHNSGHTIYEVWYAGDDGVEGWHAFDAFIAWYFVDERGEVASCEQLAADHNLAQNPLPGHSLPLGWSTDVGVLGHRHMMSDALDIVQPVQNKILSYDLQPGQTYSNLWQPEDPRHAIVMNTEAPVGERGKHYPDGSHCSIEAYDHEGKLNFPLHEPYWEAYRWPATGNPRKNVRWHGRGNLIWQPLNYGEQVMEHSANAKIENGRLSPTGTNKHMEVWYRIKLPYLASHIIVDGTAEGSGYYGICISADEGRTIWPVVTGKPYWFHQINCKADYIAGKPTVAGLQEFLIRVDMNTNTPQSNLCLSALRIKVGYQHNMHMQPRLLPGDNPLYLEADKIDDGHQLTATWHATTPDGEISEELQLDKAGKTEKTVNLDYTRPEDIVARGVTVSLK